MPLRLGGGTRVLSLFFACIAQSGERKTSADNKAALGIKAAERELGREYARNIEAWEAMMSAHKAEVRRRASPAAEGNGDHQPVPHPGPRPRSGIILYRDPTIEGLLKGLKEGQPCGGLFTTEGARLVGGHAFKEDAKLRTMGTLCEIWDDGRTDYIRVNERTRIDCRLTMWVMMQPAVFVIFAKDGLANEQGLLARVLLAQPESLMGTRYAAERRDGERVLEGQERTARDEAAAEVLGRFAERVRQRLVEAAPRVCLFPPEPGEPEPEPVPEWEPPSRCLRLAPEAEALLVRYHDEAKERELLEGGRYRLVSGFAEKTPELAARMAGAFTLFADKDAEIISEASIRCALRVIYFFLEERLRISGAVKSQHVKDCELVLSWLQNNRVGRNITMSDAVKSGPKATRKASLMNTVFWRLEQFGWLEPKIASDGKKYWRVLADGAGAASLRPDGASVHQGAPGDRRAPVENQGSSGT
jgi:putative DNA primase/helicase